MFAAPDTGKSPDATLLMESVKEASTYPGGQAADAKGSKLNVHVWNAKAASPPVTSKTANPEAPVKLFTVWLFGMLASKVVTFGPFSGGPLTVGFVANCCATAP